MKDGIGEGYTREDHQDLANQLFATYSKVGELRSLAQIIGEDDMSESDQTILEFGRQFELRFLTQGIDENRSVVESLDLGWELLSTLPPESLDRVSPDIKNKYLGRR